MMRPLSDEELKEWSATVSMAAMAVPILVDSLSLLRPYHNEDVPIAGIDPHWRIGLGDEFFILTPKRQIFVIVHEAMHLLGNHFERSKNAHHTDSKSSMISQDIEIDEQMRDMSGMMRPKGYPLPEDYSLRPHDSMEAYYPHVFDVLHPEGDSAQSVPSTSSEESGSETSGEGSSSEMEDTSEADGENEDGQSSSQDSENNEDGLDGDNGSGGGKYDESDEGCSESDPTKMSMDADMAGIQKVSPVATSDAVRRTFENAQNAQRQYGKGTADFSFASGLIESMRPPKENWRSILRRVSAATKVRKSYQSLERTYSKINVRGSAFGGDVILPGLTSYSPLVMMALDTSGSMSADEIQSALFEAQGIVKAGSGSLQFSAFCVDTEMKDVQMVDDVRKLDITGGGGTDMAPAFRYISELPHQKRPDVFILATDAGVPWEAVKRFMPTWNCSVIILVTEKNGMKKVPEWLRSNASVIDISTR